jgi:NAD+ synthase
MAKTPEPTRWKTDYAAAVMALRDYMAVAPDLKQVLLGLPGGVIRRLPAIAADALGPDTVRCVMMPSEYTSDASLDDAKVAAALGVWCKTLGDRCYTYGGTQTLAPLFADWTIGRPKRISSRAFVRC